MNIGHSSLRAGYRRGYSFLELIVVVGIVAILASIIIVNLTVSRQAARDSARKDSIKGYQIALEQYRVSRGTYMVFYYSPWKASDSDHSNTYSNYPDSSGTDLPTVSQLKPLYGTGTVGSPVYTYLKATSPALAWQVGYLGGGWGRMNTKSSTTNYESAYSISDALIKSGFLTAARLDPKANSETVIDSTQPDFVLTLCDSKATAITGASTPAQATEYAIFAKLERPLSGAATTDYTHLCGGNVAAALFTTTLGTVVNYGDGSRRW